MTKDELNVPGHLGGGGAFCLLTAGTGLQSRCLTERCDSVSAAGHTTGRWHLPKLSPEARAVAAASLVQAHAALLGGVYAGRKEGSTVNVVPQELVEKMFVYYLGVVELDEEPD